MEKGDHAGHEGKYWVDNIIVIAPLVMSEAHTCGIDIINFFILQMY